MNFWITCPQKLMNAALDIKVTRKEDRTIYFQKDWANTTAKNIATKTMEYLCKSIFLLKTVAAWQFTQNFEKKLTVVKKLTALWKKTKP